LSDQVLVIEGLAQHFGGLRAVDGVSLEVAQGEIVGLVGPNGSGKTTLINCVCGLYRPSAGRITLEGTDITGWRPDRLARVGINRTFQIPRPFLDLTVRQNLEVARANAPKEASSDPDEVLELVGLGRFARTMASSLNSTQKKLLDLARALVLAPKVLFLDEMAAGLTPAELSEMAALVKQVAEGRAVVVVEHLMAFLGEVTNRVLVLNAGKEIFRGLLSEALRDDEVKRVFLGGTGSA
jgi:branched-chain amino acid transport system ATP-binding protein